MKRFVLLLSLAVLASVIATPALAGVLDCSTLANNLVRNCGFETAGSTEWSLSGDIRYVGLSASSPHSSNFAMEFGTFGSTSTLTQDIPTAAGGSYNLYFWLANEGGTPSSFEVSWGGVTLYSETGADAYGYTGFSFSGLAASGDSTPLAFTARQDPAYYYLDDVQLTATPEPGTLAMLLGGLGVVLFNCRKRRSTN